MANCNTPVYSDGFVFWPCGYRKGGICLKMTAKGQEVAAEKAWQTRDADCHHGGMVLHDGYLYGNSGNGFVCIDFKTGKTMWHTRDRTEGAQTIPKGSTCWADGMFYGPSGFSGCFSIGQYAVKHSEAPFTSVV